MNWWNIILGVLLILISLILFYFEYFGYIKDEYKFYKGSSKLNEEKEPRKYRYVSIKTLFGLIIMFVIGLYILFKEFSY